MTTSRAMTMVSSLAASLVVSACQGAATTPTSAPGAPATSATHTAPTASPPTVVTPSLLSCPTARPLASLAVLAHTDLSPDDLLAQPDGTVWVSDPDSGRIEHIDGSGRAVVTIADPQAPEGMVAAGPFIVLAEQRTNRLVRFAPPATARTVIATLPSRGAAEGIDGIGVDAASGRLLIPDSPDGTLLSANPDGTGIQTVATGLGRDVGATLGPDGAIWVAVEGARGLLRVPGTGGAATAVGGADVTQLDDIVAAGPLLYATSLTTDEVVAIDPATGSDRALVTGGHSLQGLALLADGRLAVANSTSRVIATFAPC